mgnify:FL=1
MNTQTKLTNLLNELSTKVNDDRLASLVQLAVSEHMNADQQEAFFLEAENLSMLPLTNQTQNLTSTTVLDAGLVHVNMSGFSVCINKTDEGIVTDIWEKGFEGSESLGSTYVFDSELPQLPELKTSNMQAKKLWTQLSNIPTNDEGEIEESFQHFEAGTDREEIWGWFEEEFDLSVAVDLMNLQ